MPAFRIVEALDVVEYIGSRFVPPPAHAVATNECRRHQRNKPRNASDGTRYGEKPIARGALYLMLQNRIYRGETVHKDQSYPGEHESIIDEALWSEVQSILTETPVALTEFARALKIPKSTMSRFLSTPESLGFVMREKESGKFDRDNRLQCILSSFASAPHDDHDGHLSSSLARALRMLSRCSRGLSISSTRRTQSILPMSNG